MAIRTSLTVDYGSGIAAGIKRDATAMTAGTNRMVRGVDRLRGAVNRLDSGMGRLFNRWTGLATGVVGGAFLHTTLSTADRLNRVGTQLNFTSEQIDNYKTAIHSAAIESKVASAEIIGAVETIANKAPEALSPESIDIIGNIIQANNARGAEVGALYASLSKNLNLTTEETIQAIAALYEQGKEGSFPLGQLAGQMDRVTAATGGLALAGLKSAVEMGGLLQVLRDGVGSSEQAATAYEAILRTFTNATKVNILKGYEIEMKDSKGNHRAVSDILKDIIKKSVGADGLADPIFLSTIFGEEAMRGINALVTKFNRTGDFSALDNFLEISGDLAVVLEDVERNGSSVYSNMVAIREVGQRWAELKLAKPLQELTDAMQNLSPEELEKILDVAKNVALSLGGIWVLLKLIRGGFAIGDFMARRNTIRNAGVGGGFGAGVMPVYVVNMGAGGMGGKGGYYGGGGGGKGSRFGKWGRWVGRGAGGAGALIAGGSYLYNNGLPTNFTSGGGLVGSMGGAFGGALAGAAAGSVVPVVGTAIGAILGGLIGSVAGENLGEAIGGVIDINITSDGRAEVVRAEAKGNTVLGFHDYGDNGIALHP